MKESAAVRDGLLAFYERFTAGDPVAFAEGISSAVGVSVTGSAPGEGHEGRADWIAAYEKGAAAGIRLEGEDPRGYEEGQLGWAVDQPAFVMPDGGRLPTRLTAVLRQEDGQWKIVHLHFSVGVPDEEAIQPPAR